MKKGIKRKIEEVEKVVNKVKKRIINKKSKIGEIEISEITVKVKRNGIIGKTKGNIK